MRLLTPDDAEPDRSRGAVLLLLAASIPLLLATAAIVVDLGFLHAKRAEVQNAADSAVLAGSLELPDDQAGAAEAAGRYAMWSLGEEPVAGTSCGAGMYCFTQGTTEVTVSSPYTDESGEFESGEVVHAEVCAQRNSFFGALFGADRLRTCATATAAGWATPGTGPCGLCLLKPTGTILDQTGAGTVQVVGGAIAVNSSSSSAVKLTGSGSVVSDTSFGIVGGYSAPAGALSPTPTSSSPIDDPLAGLPVPSLPGTPAPKVSISGSASVTLTPGIYSEIVSSSTGQIKLEPGIYVITKQIKLNKSPAFPNYSFYADGVMIYLACSSYPTPCPPGTSGANMELSGGATMYWTPPVTGSWVGISLFGDRENTSELKLTGSSASLFSGSLYHKNGTLSMTGPSGVTTGFDAMVAVGALKKTGDSSILIDTTASSGSSGGPTGRRLIG